MLHAGCVMVFWGVPDSSLVGVHHKLAKSSFQKAASMQMRACAGTREAVAEQLRLGQELRRRIERPEEGGASDRERSGASSDDDDDDSGSDGSQGAAQPANGGDRSRAGRSALAKAKAAALDIINSAHHNPFCPSAFASF
jgi:U3 small nucleolar RNA-associated protein 14